MLREAPVYLHTVYPGTRLDSDFGMRSLISVQNLFSSAPYSAEVLDEPGENPNVREVKCIRACEQSTVDG